MRKNILSVIILFTMSLGLLASEGTDVSATQLTVRSFDANHSTLAEATPDYTIESIDFTNRHFDYLESNLAGQIRLIGAPDLPSSSTLLAVPSTGDISADFTYSSLRVETNVNLAPFQPVQLETETVGSSFQIDQEIYTRDAWFPASPIIIHDRVTMRDLDLVTVEVTPFQYNPVRKELRVYTGLEVTVHHAEPLVAPERPISRYFEPLYRSMVPNAALVLEPNYQTPSILYIHPNNSTVQLVLQNLVSWRHEMGYEVHTVSTTVTGSSNSAIKSYIQTAYDTWENPPEFVVLVGDAGGAFNIPTWTESWSGYNGEGDVPYVQLAGGDYIADAFIGRLPFGSTTEFTNIISKILNYEKTPNTSDPTWFSRALLVGDQASSGLSTIMINRNINEYMEHNGFHDNFQVYNGSFVSEIASGINAGVSYFNYRGWLGMSGWGNSNTSNLTNGSRLPFVTILTCGTGSFTGDARSEKFLRVGTSSVPKGAIAAVGTATTGTHTLYNNCVSVGIYHGIFSDQIYQAGAALQRGRLNLNQTYPSNSHNYVQIFSHWNNLMGDPALELWTGTPNTLTVETAAELPSDAQYLDVTVNSILGAGLPQAWVTLTGTDVFVSSYTDADGQVVLELPENLPTSLTLTVTRHNYQPVQSTITVSDAAFAVLIDTSALNESVGNSDGLLNPGETAQLDWSFSNHSAATVHNINVTVAGEDGSESVFSYDSLTAGQIITLNAQNFVIAPDFPGLAQFDVAITVDVAGTAYQDHRRFDVTAPYLQINVVGETGASPYSFDPGEISDMVLYCENVGRSGSSNLTAVLHCSNPNVELVDSTAVFTDAAPGETSDNSAASFRVNINTQVTVGVQIPFQVEFTDDSGFIEHRSFLLPIGTPDVGDPTGPDAGGYFCYSDQDLAYALAPVYDWIEIVPGMSGTPGTLVNLNDNGTNQEAIETVDIPFDFGFYGIDYNQVSICSNGYLGLGESQVALFRNYPVPGPMGPNPMIAAFWDDLVMGSGDVYTYFNASEHFFVIEYYHMQNAFSNSTETFQIILYDADYYGSTDGNGDIKIQYQTYNNDNTGTEYSSSHGQYSTTGIEDHTGQVGLEYTYNNTPAPTAHELTDNSALLFTTRTDAVLPCPGWARGDINHDGYRNVQDLVIMVNAILGETTIGECEFWAADMSLDSTVSVSDIVLLVDNVLGNALARPAEYQPGQADFIIDGNTVSLRSSRPAEAFTFTVNSQLQPTLIPHEGLTLITRDTGYDLRILGYWAGDAPREVELLKFPGTAFSITYPEAADGSGTVLQANVVELPERFTVNSVFPNPFNPTVNIQYSLPVAGAVTIRIFNALGQEVSHSVRQLAAGEQTFSWNGLDQAAHQVSSGIYFARLSTGNAEQMVKLTLLR